MDIKKYRKFLPPGYPEEQKDITLQELTKLAELGVFLYLQGFSQPKQKEMLKDEKETNTI